MAKEKYFTTQELMEQFRVSRFAITRAINSGKLVVSKKEGRKNLFSEKSVADFINSKE